MTNLESLSTPITPPFWTYKAYREAEELMDHSLATYGLASGAWRWGFLTVTQRNYIRSTYFVADSARLYLKTKKRSGSYVTVIAEVYWPPEEEVQAGRVIDFTLPFTIIQEV
jgi:hypothetical protein